MNLMLDLVDKVKYGFIIYYTDFYRQRHIIILPFKIYNKLKILKTIEYEVEINEVNTRVTVTLKKDQYSFKLKNGTLNIPIWKLEKKNTKAYCFQSYIHIKVLDNFDQIISQGYRFLKNYDTKFKAKYFVDKFAFKFAERYKNYFINSEISHDLINTPNELYNNDIIYECNYLFHTRNFSGKVLYSFIIVSVEKA